MPKGGVGSKDNKIIRAYGRDNLTDNGELRLCFANNHDLMFSNTFFSTPKGGVSHAFNGRGNKRVEYTITRQRDRKLVRNVTLHPQPSFLSIPERNIMSAPFKLIPHFARNRWLGTSVKPPVECSRLMSDCQLRREIESQRSEGTSGQTRQEMAMWATWKPHSVRPSCGPLS